MDYMNERHLKQIVMLNQDRTQVQGYIHQSNILGFLIDHYNGDISFFEQPLKNFGDSKLT